MADMIYLIGPNGDKGPSIERQLLVHAIIFLLDENADDFSTTASHDDMSKLADLADFLNACAVEDGPEI
ncbi:MAG: hypothetical protein KGL39_39810 [Patescibacteria group bacterium]|nr:hypothetical protein [Patescibacteria group bacterium]